MIAGFALCGLSLGLALGLLQVRLYEARLALEVESINSEFLNMKQVQPLDEGGVSNPFSDIQTQIKILQSDMLHRDVIERISKKQDKFKVPARLGHFRIPAPFMRISSADATRREAEQIAASLQVRALGQTRIIEVSARSSDPQFAAEFLNEMNAAYIDQNMKARWEMGQHTTEALRRVLDESRLKLRDSESALQSYALDADLVLLSQNSNVADQKLSELQNELSKAQESRIAAQSNLEMASLAHDEETSALPETISQAGLREDRTKLVELRRQRAELATLYTSDYIGIQKLDADIDSIQTSLNAEKQKIRAQLRNEFLASQRREALIRAEYDRQMQIVTGLAKHSVQYNMLQREAQGDRQVYDEVLKQVKDASIATAMGASNIRTVDPAVPPLAPIGPGPLVDSVLGLFSFSAMGILLARLRYASRSAFHDPGDVFTSTGLTELGFIPHDPRRLPFSTPSLTKQISEELQTPSQFPRLRSKPVSRRGLPGRNAREESSLTEAYRNVVVSLLSETGSAGARIVAVTSALQNEGKTTVVANLGAICAAAGKRVLMIDADLIRGGLSRLLQVETERGLTDLLDNPAAGTLSEQDLLQLIRPAGISEASVLPRGTYSESTRNRLHLPVLGQVLRRVAAPYDLVLIDTPSVIPLADARLVAQLCQGVVLVVRSGIAVPDAVTLTRGRLEMSGARIIGTVLNDWDPAGSTLQHYFDYDNTSRARIRR